MFLAIQMFYDDVEGTRDFIIGVFSSVALARAAVEEMMKMEKENERFYVVKQYTTNKICGGAVWVEVAHWKGAGTEEIVWEPRELSVPCIDARKQLAYLILSDDPTALDMATDMMRL